MKISYDEDLKAAGLSDAIKNCHVQLIQPSVRTSKSFLLADFSKTGVFMTAPTDAKLTAARARYSQDRSELTDVLATLKRAAAGPDLRATNALSAVFRVSAETDFRPQLIEPLFQQAAGFLASAIAGEAAYRQLRVQQINLMLDIKELEDLSAIHDDEVAAGVFNVPYWAAEASVLSDQALSDAQTSMSNWVKDQMDSQTMNAVWTSENSQKPMGQGWEGKLSDHTPKLYSGKWKIDPAEQTTILGSEPVTAGYAIGGVLTSRAVSYSFNYVLQQISTQTAPLASRKAPLTSRASYLQADAGFRERRRVVAHEKLVAKLAAIAVPDGPMNYSDRINKITSQANHGIAEAVLRFSAAKNGLKIVFGVDAPELPAPPSPPGEPLSSTYLFALAQWSQNLADQIQKLKQDDQATVHRVSLRSLMTNAVWDAGLPGGKWTFQLVADQFKGLKTVRLRGVTAWTKYAPRVDAFIPAGLSLDAPAQSSAIYSSGAGTRVASITQAIARCRIGRSQQWYKSDIPPDIAGQNALFNASPIGTWSIHTVPNADLFGLEDIIFDFFLVAQQA